MAYRIWLDSRASASLIEVGAGTLTPKGEQLLALIAGRGRPDQLVWCGTEPVPINVLSRDFGAQTLVTDQPISHVWAEWAKQVGADDRILLVSDDTAVTFAMAHDRLEWAVPGGHCLTRDGIAAQWDIASKQVQDWGALQHVRKVGPGVAAQWLRQYETARQVFDQVSLRPVGAAAISLAMTGLPAADVERIPVLPALQAIEPGKWTGVARQKAGNQTKIHVLAGAEESLAKLMTLRAERAVAIVPRLECGVLTAIGLAHKDDEAWFLSVPNERELAAVWFRELGAVLSADRPRKIVFNGKEFIRGLQALGMTLATNTIDLQGLTCLTRDHTLAADLNRILLEEGNRQLDNQAEHACLAMQAEGVWVTSKNLYRELKENTALYAWHEEVESHLPHLLAKMELAGMPVNRKRLDTLESSLVEFDTQTRAALAAKGLHRLGDLTDSEISQLLYDRLQLPVLRRTDSGSPAVDKTTLATLAKDHPIVATIADLRRNHLFLERNVRLLKTHLNRLTGCVHTHFDPLTAPGRIVSYEPNLQNIPARDADLAGRIRSVLEAPEGKLILSADFKQLDPTVFAHLSGDPLLQRIHRERVDIYQFMASFLLGKPRHAIKEDERDFFKEFHLKMIYGVTVWGIADALNIPISEAEGLQQRYFAKLPGLARYIERVQHEAITYGYVTTMHGRCLQVPEAQSEQAKEQRSGLRRAVNLAVSGSAAEVTKRAMTALDKYFIEHGLRADLRMQVYDEFIMVFDPTDIRVLPAVERIMTTSSALTVPLAVKLYTGTSMGDLTPAANGSTSHHQYGSLEAI